MRWGTVTLGDACNVIAGGTPKRSQPTFWGGGIPWVKISDMIQGRIASTEETISEEGLANSAAKLLPKGTLLISIFATIGRTAVLDCEAATNQAIVGVIPKDRSAFDSGFLLHCLNHKSRELAQQARGVAQANINGSVLKALQLPLPPLPEQKRVAAILDNADALRAKRRESIEQLDLLIQATFLEMFGDPVTNPMGWNTTDAAAIVKEGTSITYGIVQAGDEFPGGVPYIRTGDIVNGEVAVEQLRRTNPAIAAKFERSRVDAGDIVMSIRATVGTSALVTNGVAGANLTQGTARISPSSQVRSNYLLHYIRTEGCQQWIQQQVKGATFREITLGRLRQMPVLVPPLLLQTRFASIVESIEQQKARLKAHLAELDTLFASLQSRAFNGELVA
jgi:type I restriction enzyme S subunit